MNTRLNDVTKGKFPTKTTDSVNGFGEFISMFSIFPLLSPSPYRLTPSLYTISAIR